MYKYPYQVTEADGGYQPAIIRAKKEMYCVGFSIAWHALLSELAIQHKWLNIPWHSALEVDIWGKRYYFDAASTDQVYVFTYGENVWVYQKMIVQWASRLNDIAISWNPEKILQWQIYTQKWNVVSKLWKDEEAIEQYKKAIELNPKDADVYNNRWVVLGELWKSKLANLSQFVSNILKTWEDSFWDFDILYREEKTKISNFIKNEKYEKLKDYMFSLE